MLKAWDPMLTSYQKAPNRVSRLGCFNVFGPHHNNIRSRRSHALTLVPMICDSGSNWRPRPTSKASSFWAAWTRETPSFHGFKWLPLYKLHQHRPQTATNHVSTTFMRNKEFIGRPIPETRNERKEGRQAPEPEPGTRRSQKITMEHNPFPEKGKKRKVGKQAPEP